MESPTRDVAGAGRIVMAGGAVVDSLDVTYCHIGGQNVIAAGTEAE